jgi:hypothetical protein
MTAPIVITLVPIREPANHMHELWGAEVDGEVLVQRSATALRDAARRLLRVGHDPSTPVIARYYGDASGAELRTTLRSAGELSPLGKVA